MSFQRSPTERSQVAARRTTDTSPYISAGRDKKNNPLDPTARGISQMGGMLNSFLEGRLENEEKEAKANAAARLKLATADAMSRMKADPLKARQSASSGDVSWITSDPSLLDSEAYLTASLDAAGSSGAMADLSSLNDQLKDSLTPVRTRAEFIAKQTVGMSDVSAISYRNTLVAKTDGAIAEAQSKHREATLNTSLARVQDLARTTILDNELTDENVSGAMQQLIAAHSPMVGGAAAASKAVEDFDAIVLQGVANGNGNADRLASMRIADRAPLSVRNSEAVQKARQTAIANRGKVKSLKQDSHLESVERLVDDADALGTSSSVSKATSAFAAYETQYGMQAEKAQALRRRIVAAHKAAVATKTNVEISTVHGVVTDNKTLELLSNPESAKEHLTAAGVPPDSVALKRHALLRDSGYGPKYRKVVTQVILDPNADADTKINTIGEAALLAISSKREGSGRYWNKEADVLMAEVVRVAKATSDPASRVPALNNVLERYARATELHEGQGPSAARTGKTAAELDEQASDALDQLAESRGVPRSSLNSLLPIAREAVIRGHWWSVGSPNANAAALDYASSSLSTKVSPALSIDDDGDITFTTSPNRAMGRGLTVDDAEDLKAAMATVPKSYRENGIRVEQDALTDKLNSHAVTIQSEDGISNDPMVFRPGEVITFSTEDGESELFKQFMETKGQPELKERGIRMGRVPEVPAVGDEVRDLGDGFSLYFDRNAATPVWRLRYSSVDEDDKRLKMSEADADRQRLLGINTEEANKKTAADVASELGLPRSATDSLDYNAEPEQVLEQLLKRSKRQGKHPAGSEGPLFTQVQTQTRDIASLSPTPVDRRTNLVDPASKDLIVGRGFNLQRKNAKEMLAEVDLDIEAVTAGVQRVSAEKAVKLTELATKDSYARLREAVGHESIQELSTGQVAALLTLINTGAFTSTGKPAVLSPKLVRAIKSGDNDAVVSALESRHENTSKIAMRTRKMRAAAKLKEDNEVRKAQGLKPKPPVSFEDDPERGTITNIENVGLTEAVANAQQMFKGK